MQFGRQQSIRYTLCCMHMHYMNGAVVNPNIEMGHINYQHIYIQLTQAESALHTYFYPCVFLEPSHNLNLEMCLMYI